MSKKDKQAATNVNNEIQSTLHKNLGFAAREQYKMLRTSLSFTMPEVTKCAVIGVTSSIRAEGKSTTSINLAYALAEDGKKVLLIDGDLRIPSIAKKMGIKSTPGLTNLLLGVESLQLSNFRSGILDNWYILPAGDIPPNPSELMGSHKMEKLLKILSDSFDYIIVDLPPVNVVTDAIAISKLLTGMVLVVRENYTEKSELQNCVRKLQLSDVKILGCVMNVTGGGGTYYNKYKYRKYYNYHKSSGYYGYYESSHSGEKKK